MFNFYKKTTRPSLFLCLTEVGRALTELGVTYPYNKFRNREEEGDGHPVLILPGFMSSDTSTKLLRDFVRKSGYVVYDWGLGRNLGKIEYLDILVETVEAIQKKHKRKVSLIGWSLGGVFAREIAKARPELVRQVITMGSPFRGVREPNNVAWIYNLISGGQKVKNTDLALIETFPLPASVPTTAIYTKEDGIVPWQLCLEEQEDRWHQNIQVHGSHCGLGVNTSVLWLVSDRLKYTKENWAHFKPKNFMTELLFYPSV